MYRPLAVVTGLAFLIALAPTASAHGLTSSGVAILNDEVYHTFFDASFDPFGNMACRLIITSPLDIDNPVVDVAFTIETNFADAHSVPVVNPDYWAKSVSTGVDFQLNGTQLAGQIQATGHYENYTLHLTAVPGVHL